MVPAFVAILSPLCSCLFEQLSADGQAIVILAKQFFAKNRCSVMKRIRDELTRRKSGEQCALRARTPSTCHRAQFTQLQFCG
jgi:hypothetical protein